MNTKKLLSCVYDDHECWDTVNEIHNNENDLQLRINELCMWSNYNRMEYGPHAYGVIKELKVYEIASEQDIVVDSDVYCELARKQLEEEVLIEDQKEREANQKEFYRLKELLQID
jgi:hypothetical protein